MGKKIVEGTIRIKFKQKLHALYLAGCDNRAFVGDDMEEAILEDISTLLKQEKQKMGKALRMEKKPIKSGRELTPQQFIQELDDDEFDRKLQDKILQLVKNEGFNQAVKENNKKIDNYLKGKK